LNPSDPLRCSHRLKKTLSVHSTSQAKHMGNDALIFINGRFLSQQIEGVHRYAMECVRALDALLGGSGGPRPHRFILLSPRRTIHDLPLTTIEHRRIGFFSRHAWEQIDLPLHVGRRPLVNMYTAPLLKKNQLITLHDASVFEKPRFYTAAYALFYRSAFRLLCRRSRGVITVSGFSRGRFARYCACPADGIHVVCEGHEHMLRTAPDAGVFEKHRISRKKPFVLAVGINDRKNMTGILEAAGRLSRDDVPVIMTGRSNPRLTASQGARVPGNVRFIGYVSDNELRALYDQAACLVYPSLYEGFGLPPLEAMACGCPVVVSGIPLFSELYGDAAMTCDPENAADIARKIMLILDNPAVREQLKHRGLERARQFTWHKCAQQTYDIIRKLLL